MIRKRSENLYLKNFHKFALILTIFFFFVSCVSHELRLKTVYDKAEAFYITGNTEKAISYYKTIIERVEENRDISPFIRSYYKAISYLRIGEKDKSIKEIENMPVPPSEFQENFLLLKAIYYNKLGLNIISNEISENLLKSKNKEILRESALLFSQNSIKLFKEGKIEKKDYLSTIKKIKSLLKKDFLFPYFHYALFSLYLNSEAYKDALNEAILALDMGIKGIYRKDLLFSLKYIKTKLSDNDLEKYKEILRRYNVTDN